MGQQALRHRQESQLMRLVCQVFEQVLPLLELLTVLDIISFDFFAKKVRDHEHANVH